MAVRLKFDFLGDVQLDRTLARFEEAPADARPVWDALADRFVTHSRTQFRTEGAASGGWAPLSPAYGAWKARHYPGAGILHREGDLEASVTQRPLDVEVLEPGFMRLGTGVEYATYHQHGTDRMPQRRIIDLPEQERREWVRVMQRFLMTGRAR